MYIEDKFCNFENKFLIKYPHNGVYNFISTLAPTPGPECLRPEGLSLECLSRVALSQECLRPEVIEFKLFLLII